MENFEVPEIHWRNVRKILRKLFHGREDCLKHQSPPLYYHSLRKKISQLSQSHSRLPNVRLCANCAIENQPRVPTDSNRTKQLVVYWFKRFHGPWHTPHVSRIFRSVLIIEGISTWIITHTTSRSFSNRFQFSKRPFVEIRSLNKV